MRKKLLFGGVAIATVICALSLLHGAKRENAPSSAAMLLVNIDNFSFSPETVSVPVNSTVTWVNKDDVPHVIASTQGVFKSRALDTDDKYSYKFTKPGTYSYFCSIHPSMVGKIVVR
ncbi:MAG TPA: cupredoxin family copper-binding protein [Terriglobales bacterium]|nr:cupredoxin family copper-binding protein [Terriglobales bacterium]